MRRAASLSVRMFLPVVISERGKFQKDFLSAGAETAAELCLWGGCVRSVFRVRTWLRSIVEKISDGLIVESSFLYFVILNLVQDLVFNVLTEKIKVKNKGLLLFLDEK